MHMFLIKSVYMYACGKEVKPSSDHPPPFFFLSSLPIGSFTEPENGQTPRAQAALELAAGGGERAHWRLSACCSLMIPVWSLEPTVHSLEYLQL